MKTPCELSGPDVSALEETFRRALAGDSAARLELYRLVTMTWPEIAGTRGEIRKQKA